VLRAWGYFFHEGVKALQRVAMGLLWLRQRDLLALNGKLEMSGLLRSPSVGTPSTRRRSRAAPRSLRCRGCRGRALNTASQQQRQQQQRFINSFHHGDTSLSPGSTPVQYGCAALYTFSHLFQPLAPHKESQSHPLSPSSENTPIHPLRQSKHTRRASLLCVLTHAQRTRAHFNPQYRLFMLFGFVLVRVRDSTCALVHVFCCCAKRALQPQ